jgi:hypothetical protein
MLGRKVIELIELNDSSGSSLFGLFDVRLCRNSMEDSLRRLKGALASSSKDREMVEFSIDRRDDVKFVDRRVKFVDHLE